MAILAIVIGVIYFQLEDNYAGFQNRCKILNLYIIHFNTLCRVGAFFFLITNIVFGSLSALELFIKERSLFMYVCYIRVTQYRCE